MSRGSIVAALVLLTAACSPPQEPRLVLGAPSVAVAAAAPEPRSPPAVRPRKLVVAASQDDALAVVRDQRPVGPLRTRQLLVTEIQGLESMFATTPPSAQDRPRLMWRLTEGYVELGAAAQRDKAAAPTPDEATRADKIAVAARMAAIKYYALIKSQHPKWCANLDPNDPLKSTGCADEALYYLAYESERAWMLDQARKAYLDLLQNWPQSKLVPSAYLAFGEMFLRESEGDPSKLGLAEQSYEEVLKYPPPDNAVFGYAHYQLAKVLARTGDRVRAMFELDAAGAYAKMYAGAPGSAELAAAVQRRQAHLDAQ